MAGIGIAGLVFVWRLYGDCMESWLLEMTVQSQFGTLLEAGSVLFLTRWQSNSLDMPRQETFLLNRSALNLTACGVERR